MKPLFSIKLRLDLYILSAETHEFSICFIIYIIALSTIGKCHTDPTLMSFHCTSKFVGPKQGNKHIINGASGVKTHTRDIPHGMNLVSQSHVVGGTHAGVL